MKTIYKCELCEQEFESWEACFAHESEHLKPKGFQCGKYKIDCPYPEEIVVEMSNGEKVKYKYECLCTI
jgi:hypothetical protein